jgi:hypothetical protein
MSAPLVIMYACGAVVGAGLGATVMTVFHVRGCNEIHKIFDGRSIGKKTTARERADRLSDELCCTSRKSS